LIFKNLMSIRKKEYNKDITKILASKAFDRVTNDQLRRASFSIMLNIAEGSSRFSNKDRRNFLVVSRGSAFECAAILEYLYEINELNQEIFDKYFAFLEEISKMLYSLIKRLDDDINKKE
jgi:four helix bundle protein